MSLGYADARSALAPAAPRVVKQGIEQLGDWLELGFKFGGVNVTLGSVLGSLLLAVFLLASAVLKQSHTALEKHGIELPFPQRDLYIKSWVWFERRPDAAPAASEPAGSRESALDNDAARDVARDIAEQSASRPGPTPSSPAKDPRAAH